MGPNTHQRDFEDRRQRLASQFERKRIGALLVTSLPNIFYLTGFRGSAGAALVGPSESVLWVDPRYTLQAKEQVERVEVVEVKGGLLKEAARWIRKKRLGPVGYDDATLTCRDFEALEKAAGSRRWVPAGGMVEELRAVKSPLEVDWIRRAGKLTAEVFEEVRGLVRPGARECDLAAEIEYRMKRKGADGAAFETIVASGERSAWPHAKPTAKSLNENDLVIIDLGAILGGYAADMTRTVYLGKPSARIRMLYNQVREAQERAVKAATPGQRAGEVDSQARKVLDKKKLERFFTHSTGHGVGLEIHEMPRLARGDKSRLQKGHVITIEPGVYLEGLGGVRIEDTILVTEGKPENLTPATKDAWFAS
ncbi:MAG TPA: Xaa-Pro peptidase family protein [Terriglobia bacterium]|jgi:Xaa-Pro aminopeptidase|nr:Xaa-Pro peptidase family protein [Terriglobia bacterium]